MSTLLGTEASVRVLRELALHGEELTTTFLARRTGITDQSVRNVLGVLAQTGLLKVYGQGRAASYQIDASHPVSGMLVELFRAEDQRIAALLEKIRGVAERQSPRPPALWMYGSVARGEDRVDSDMDLLLVVEDDSHTESDADAFREEVSEIGEEHHVSISVVAVSGDDVLRLARIGDPFWREILADGVPLHGPGPEGLLSRLKRRERSPAFGEVLDG